MMEDPNPGLVPYLWLTDLEDQKHKDPTDSDLDPEHCIVDMGLKHV